MSILESLTHPSEIVSSSVSSTSTSLLSFECTDSQSESLSSEESKMEGVPGAFPKAKEEHQITKPPWGQSVRRTDRSRTWHQWIQSPRLRWSVMGEQGEEVVGSEEQRGQWVQVDRWMVGQTHGQWECESGQSAGLRWRGCEIAGWQSHLG